MKPQSHYKQIDYQERETIALGVETGLSIRAIARMLSRPPSTISREVKRNAPGDPTVAVWPSNAACADDALLTHWRSW